MSKEQVMSKSESTPYIVSMMLAAALLDTSHGLPSAVENTVRQMRNGSKKEFSIFAHEVLVNMMKLIANTPEGQGARLKAASLAREIYGCALKDGLAIYNDALGKLTSEDPLNAEDRVALLPLIANEADAFETVASALIKDSKQTLSLASDNIHTSKFLNRQAADMNEALAKVKCLCGKCPPHESEETTH